MNLFVLTYFLMLTGGATSMNVLIAGPCAMMSFHGLLSHIATLIAEAGHSVTLISTFPMTDPHPRITTVTVPDFVQYLDDINIFESRSPLNATRIGLNLTEPAFRVTWQNPKVKEIWHRRNDFDIFITISYLFEHTFPFLEGFKGRFVQIITPGIDAYSLSRNGNWLLPSAVPALSSPYSNYMTFLERSLNLVHSIVYHVAMDYVVAAKSKEAQLYFPNITDLRCYFDRVDLTFINGHFALDGATPLLPSEILIGPLMTRPAKPLPKDIEDFMAAASHGVIYFSLGSLAKSVYIPTEVKKAFFDTFKRIPQRVLMKYEIDDLELPSNVMVRKWMPQADIIGHPNTVLFISHCGNLGTQEAKYHGVPILGFPIAFDQPRNCDKMEKLGLARVLPFDGLTSDIIVDEIHELLHNGLYKENILKLSRILKDQKESPDSRLIWWLEYIYRNPVVPGMKYAGTQLNLIQYFLLDVFIFWGLTLYLASLGLRVVVRRIFIHLWEKIYIVDAREKQD